MRAGQDVKTRRCNGAGGGTMTGFFKYARALRQSLSRWASRRQSRKALAGLEGPHLRDIGVTPEAARQEAAKPFWRA